MNKGGFFKCPATQKMCSSNVCNTTGRCQAPKLISEDLTELETLTEAAEYYAKCRSSSSVFQKAHTYDFIEGANYQAKRMYSRQDLIDFVYFINGRHFNKYTVDTDEVDLFIEQLKEK